MDDIQVNIWMVSRLFKKKKKLSIWMKSGGNPGEIHVDIHMDIHVDSSIWKSRLLFSAGVIVKI